MEKSIEKCDCAYVYRHIRHGRRKSTGGYTFKRIEK